uniref:Testis expressed 10 n=1 Tax=Lepisosteus oculatus TaxID=7918 RepID=W5MDV3_LEPOC
MTKKRKRQDDFQKVKLKVGKKKPKPDNVTNVSFKTKGIHLPEQLKSSESGPTTHRQLSIKDLLSQLHHYSGGVKQGALAGLRELLAKNPSLLDAHLSSVLSEAAAVFTDKEPGVRAAAVRLLRFLAPRVPAERVAPFFPLLGAHLSCAMTHIAEGIQEDALQALDVLLEHYPALLAARSAVLLKNFLELISQQRLWRRGRGGEERKAAPWALSVSPGRRVTSQQWRLSVLTRLGRFLQAVVEERPAEEGAGSRDVLDVGEREGGCGKITPVELTWEEHSFGKGGVQVYENAGARASVCSAFRLRPDTEPGTGLEEGLTSVETVKGFASTLVPLLLEVWVEASTSEQGSSENAHLLHPEAMSLMYQVLNILQLLRCLAPQRHDQAELDAWFRSTYLSDFRQHFMKNFPYAQVEVAKHKKKGESKRYEPVLWRFLFRIETVHPLCVRFRDGQAYKVSLDVASEQRLQTQTAYFLFNEVSISESVQWVCCREMYCSQHISSLLQILGILTVSSENSLNAAKYMRVYITKTHQDIMQEHVRTLKCGLFIVMGLQHEQNFWCREKAAVLFLFINHVTVKRRMGWEKSTLGNNVKRRGEGAIIKGLPEMIKALQRDDCLITDPEEGSVVLLPQDSQHHLVQLVYFLPSLPPDLLSCLSRCCTAGRVSASLAAALIRIVHMRSSLSGWTLGVQEAALSDVDYFSFLFSTLTGFSAEELSVLQGGSEEDMCGSSPLSPLSLYHTELEHFMHHWDVVEEVCHCLETVGSRSQCFDILQNAICKNLARLQVVPDSTAAALLRSVSRLLGPSLLPSEELLRFLASCCLSLLTLLLSLDHEPPAQDSSQKREAVWGACVGALGGVPRLLRLVLQAVQASELGEEELPLVAQLLRLLLQHSQLRNHMLANATLLQHLVQDLTRCCRGAAREQWLTDLLYCYSVALSGQHRGAAGPRDAC